VKIRFSVVALLAFLPGFAQALGLGQIDVQSGLNQPFSARIELLSATVEEMDSLRVGLADRETFGRAGMKRSADLLQLMFSVSDTGDGRPYILIKTRDPIREPFLEFIVEAAWVRGRLVRAYTVLLDPPEYAGAAIRRQAAAPPPAPPPVAAVEPAPPPVYENLALPPPIRAPRRPADYRPGDTLFVESGDTLSAIALRVRPDPSISLNQMMLALQRANPEAFIGGDINKLKGGVDLRVPDVAKIRSQDPAASDAKVRVYSQRVQEAPAAAVVAVAPLPREIPKAVASEAVAVKSPEPAQVPATPDEGEPELRILGVEAGVESGGQGHRGPPGENVDATAVIRELALARESLEALKIEKVELEDRLSAAEAIIEDLKSELERGLPLDVTVIERPLLTEYGPTVSGDTLWAIAFKIRPDPSISVNQMMLAILRTNPRAFIEGNINGLKRDVRLLIPGIAEIRSLSKSEATVEVKSHNALWQERRST